MSSYVPKEATKLLVNDLRSFLLGGNIASAMRRLNTFSMVYFEEFPGYMNTSVIVLKSGNTTFVCDEYSEADNGRVHVLGINAYASYNKITGILDLNKVAISIDSVELHLPEWPDGVPKSESAMVEFIKTLKGDTLQDES